MAGPIGIFDSGVGGLSVWREIMRQLPQERTLYFADQGHVPYGPRPISEVRRYAVGITQFLLDVGAKIIVVACNTASGAALYHLRATFPDVPFVGMEPAIKPAAKRTRSGVIGVIATPATLHGELFNQLKARFAQQVELHARACPGLVECVEGGALDDEETLSLLHTCIDPMLAAGVDHLVLGCTHYPFLRFAIRRVVGPEVALVDPAPAIARQVARVLRGSSPSPQAGRGLGGGVALPPSVPPLAEGGHSPPSVLPSTGESSPSPQAGRGLGGGVDDIKHYFFTTGSVEDLATMARLLVEYTGPVISVRWETKGVVWPGTKF